MPPRVDRGRGMDAITQLIESYISPKARPHPPGAGRARAEIGAARHRRGGQTAIPLGAREAMAHAALLSGMALANSGLGMAHGVAAALGIHCRVPHGAGLCGDAARRPESEPRSPPRPNWRGCAVRSSARPLPPGRKRPSKC